MKILNVLSRQQIKYKKILAETPKIFSISNKDEWVCSEYTIEV